MAAAASRGRRDCIQLLIEQCADAKSDLEFGHYGSPLAAAASSGRHECIQLLIEHGADVKRKLEFGLYGSALAAAVAYGHEDCARVLIDHGAEVNGYLEYGPYGSVLAAAILELRLPMVKFLVEEKKADLEKLVFFRPRRKSERFLWEWQKRGGWDRRKQREMAKYLVRDCRIDAGLLLSLGMHPQSMHSQSMC